MENSDGQYKHLVNASINTCNILSRVKSHPILKLIIKELLKTSNLPMACPFKKGIYYMKDFVLNEDLLPPFIPMGNFMSIIGVSRLVNGEEMMIMKVRLVVDIDYAKDRRAVKLF